jgi:hypothetical protein
MLLLKLDIWNLFTLVIVFGAFTGAVAFSVVSCRPGILITGALAGVMGLMLAGLVGCVAWEPLPRRLTEIEPANFAILIAFGPPMGLALGVPFSVVEKKVTRDQNALDTT